MNVARAGGIEALIRAMGAHEGHADVQEAACRALDILSINPENKVKIFRAGGIETLIKAMRAHEGHAGVQEQAFWALCNLAINPENKV
jgi:hypothetical protein